GGEGDVVIRFLHLDRMGTVRDHPRSHLDEGAVVTLEIYADSVGVRRTCRRRQRYFRAQRVLEVLGCHVSLTPWMQDEAGRISPARARYASLTRTNASSRTGCPSPS